MRKFLPASPYDYDISGRAAVGFSRAAAGLLEDVGRKMTVTQAKTEGRIPSPLSRPYIFYLNLFAKGLRDDPEGGELAPDPGRQALQKAARASFRGICAAFALRKVLGLEIRLVAVPLAPGDNPVERVLVDALSGGPRGAEQWNPLRFYTVRRAGAEKAEVLAGVSPLTGVFPAAHPPSGLTCLYWYDAQAGRWYDPTSDRLSEDGSFTVGRNPNTRRKVSQLLAAWAAKALETVDVPRALEVYGFTERDRVLLRNELKAWVSDLGSRPFVDGAVVPAPIPRAAGTVGVPFLDLVCEGPPKNLEGTPENILSDYPIHAGRLLVTRDQLLDDGKRIFGRERGGIHFAEAVMALSSSGNNLGADLGLSADRIPIAYTLVDRLFAPRMTLITTHGLSEGWSGLSIGEERFLLPFDPAVLDLLSPAELLGAVSGELDARGENYIVRLSFGEAEIPQIYRIGETGEYVADSATVPPETFDLRVFPNFDVEASAAAGALLAAERRYFARVRLSPAWDFRINAFRYHGDDRRVTIDYGTPVRVGNVRERVSQDEYHPGQTLFLTCPGRPDGFYVEGRGLVFVRFPAPAGAKAEWDVGVDFGTSNTCVSYRISSGRSPHVLRFPVLTANLLPEPFYKAVFSAPGDVLFSEGARALLDFFHRQRDTDRELMPQDYFPTQFVTRQSHPSENPDWDFDNGLIHFSNISLELPMLWELIEGYPERPDDQQRHFRRDFRAKQDLKWEETQWVEAFMRHLRLQVLMTAAGRNAQIGRVRFSYPKAFDFTQRQRYLTLLRRVWAPEGANVEVSSCSESEAVQNYIVREKTAYVVFDLGGGTTDIIAFSNQSPKLQTSFKAAAGFINQYVTESPHFRAAFLEATRQALADQRFRDLFDASLLEQFRMAPTAQGFRSDVIQTTWLGLLEALERGGALEAVLSSLRGYATDAPAEAQAAISGFFLSVTLLLCGTVYYAGAMLAAAGLGKLGGSPFHPRFVDLILTGNGSKLYRMLDHPEAPFQRVVQAMMEHGLSALDEPGATGTEPRSVEFSGLFTVDGRAAPKVTVALGLLTEAEEGTSGDTLVPVANLAGETGFGFAETSSMFDTHMVDFYRTVHQNPEALTVPAAAPAHFTRFMNRLGELLRRGSNQGMAVIPGASAQWHAELMGALYGPSHRQIRNRLLKNAGRLDHDLNAEDEDMPALESLFVVQLAALLDQVRGTYGAGQVPVRANGEAAA